MKKINIDGIPESMMNFQNWLVRVGKVPYSVKNNKCFQADPTDMNNFLYFDTAIKALETHNELSGIGFAFDGGSFVGIDIDHCVVDGKLNQLAKDILNSCKDTYVEFSVSGNGIHIIYWDTDTKGFTGRKNSNLGLEIYADKHYFAITGNRVPNTSNNFNHFQGLTKKLLAKYFSNDSTSLDSNKQNEIIKQHSNKPTYSDDEILTIIKNCDDSKFNRLFYNGDVSEYGGDDSSADMALMMKLAFYTNGNSIQMERLFGQSKLAQRNKWQKRQDYRQRTIANSINQWTINGSTSFKPQKNILTSSKNISEEEILQQKIQDFTNNAVSVIKGITSFSDENIYDIKVLKAASICQIYEPLVFKQFIDTCKAAGLSMGILQKSINKFNIEMRRTFRKLQDDLQRNQHKKILEQKQLEKIQTLKSSTELLDELSKLDKLSDEQEMQVEQLVNSLLSRNEKNAVITNVKNYEVFLNYDYYLKNCIGYDAFAYRLIALKDNLPWRQHVIIHNKEWTDDDDAGVQNRMNRISDGLNNTQMYKRVMIEFAKHHSIHPVRQYFEKLPKWDGVSRAEKVFIDALGVLDTEYARKITLHWLLAAVARIFHPGCKFDYCLVLKAPQGVGKGSILRKLAVIEEWFNSSIRNIMTKDALQDLLGRWIIELEEFKALSKVNDEYAKGFISAATDKFRPPYGTNPESFPRQCIFAASTNSAEFLKDRTGGRRWWVLVANEKSNTTVERLKKFTKEYINQIWAEVFFKFNELFKDDFDSVKLLPEQNILDKAEEIAMQYTEGSGVSGMIQEFVDRKIPRQSYWKHLNLKERRDWYQGIITTIDANRIPVADKEGNNNSSFIELKAEEYRNIVCAVEVANELFKIDNPSKDKATIREITEVLESLDDWNVITSNKNCGIYGRQRKVFERELIPY